MSGPEAIKKCILLCVLVTAAWTDSRKMRIPNKLLGAACGFWGLFFIAEWILTGEEAFIRYGTVFVKSMLLELGFVCLVIFSRYGVGFGDIKLLGVVSLYGGPRASLSCLLYGLFLAGAASLILLAAGRLSVRDRLPLAPFFLAGYVSALLY